MQVAAGTCLPPATWPIRSAPLPPGTWRETVSQSRRLRIRHRDPLPRRPWSPSASESSFILTADPPLSRAQGGKNSSMGPQDTGVHAQQEPRRRPSTHQFNAISPVMANTCLPPSSSRLMIHRHSSVAYRSRNARGMLGTVSSPIAKRAAEAPRADPPGARHQKGAQSRFLTVARGTLRYRPFAPRHGAR